jgi:hypothetical protein
LGFDVHLPLSQYKPSFHTLFGCDNAVNFFEKQFNFLCSVLKGRTLEIQAKHYSRHRPCSWFFYWATGLLPWYSGN